MSPRVLALVTLLALPGVALARPGDEEAPPCCGEEEHEGHEPPAADEEGQAAPADGAPAAAEEVVEEAEEDDDERVFAVTGGTVHTGTGAVLRGATVLARGRRIVAVGQGVVVPEEAEVLDATGMHVWPGLVAFDSRGVVGSPPGDATDVFGLELTLALATGITTVGQGGDVAKLTYGTLEGHVIARDVHVRLELGQPLARRALRQQLDRVRDYLRRRREVELAKARGEEVEEPDRKWIKGRFAAYERLLTGQAVALAGAETAGDLRRLARLAETYGFRAVVTGCTEAWTVASELGRAGLTCVVVPRSRRAPDERLVRPSGWTIENAALLHAAGVPVAIMSSSNGIATWGLAGRDLFTLPLEAAFAIRGGLPDEAALAALTLVPARALGVDDRVGSLEVGKDCDLIVTRGHLLHYRTLVEWSVVDGRVAYDKEKDTLLQHVRPRDLVDRNRVIEDWWPRKE